MIESVLQKKCLDLLRARDITFIRIEKASAVGAFDVVVFCKRVVLCVELKKSKVAKRRQQQIDLNAAVNDCCDAAEAWFIDSFESFMELIDENTY